MPKPKCPYHTDATVCVCCVKPKEGILEEAQRITGDGGARNDAYDHPMPNFSKIAVGWSILLGTSVSARQVAHMMIWMKLVRDNHKPQRDNLVDIAGYANCIDRLSEYKGEVPIVILIDETEEWADDV